uniref:Calmodulin n=1 Tax=Pinguiococcus pyrenoidosus TaxID=172671 RepID=A0A7R9YE08_9STRA|mmetsp:Transcript_5734/g.22476  ORF Transcript_5734/g.22476 Transcript_5734/m.22476 type:complete len:866 (+) Transcript_5734:198-2795(+)
MSNNKTTWRRNSVTAVEAYVALQKKTFTRWCNSYLRQRALEIDDLFTELSDGLILLNLLEIIGQKSVFAVCGRKYNKNPRMRIHRIENCNLIFEYLEKRNVQTVNISSGDIVDPNPKLVLGLIFTIILRFAVDEDGKQGLLLWCQRNTKGYNGVDVSNFHRSWADGKAFCAIINHFRPDLLDYSQVGEDPASNLELAFAAAEEAGIERLLDVEDVAGSVKPDEKSIIAQMTLYFQAFAALAQREALTGIIMKAYAVRRKHDQWIEDYESKARELVSWVDEKCARYAETPTNLSTEEVRDALKEFYAYRSEVKPSRKGQLTNLEGLIVQIRTSEANNHRAIYQPDRSIDAAVLNSSWKALEDKENAYEAELVRLYDALRSSDYLVARFKAKAGKIETFYEEALTLFGHGDGTPDYGNSVEKCQVLLERFAAHEQQYDLHAGMVGTCKELVGDISPEHKECEPCNERMAKIEEMDAVCQQAAEEYKAAVVAQLEEEKTILNMLKDFNAKAPPLEFTIDELDEAAGEPYVSGSIAAVEEAQAKLQATKEAAEAHRDALEELFALGEALESKGRDLPLTADYQTMKSEYEAILEKIDERDAQLAAALEDEKAQQKAREDFAGTASELKSFLDDASRRATALEKAGNRNASELVQTLQGLKKEFETDGQQKLEAAQAASDAQKEAGVFSNTMIGETMQSLEVDFEELGNVIRSGLDEAQATAAAAESDVEMSAQQAKEIREVFDLLDQDKSGTLTPKEFTDGAQAIGLIIPDDELDEKYIQLTRKTPGALNFDGFAAFFLEQLTRGSTKDSVVSAFRSLAGGRDAISNKTLQECFPDASALEWMTARMHVKDGTEDGLDYSDFTEDLFLV